MATRPGGSSSSIDLGDSTADESLSFDSFDLEDSAPPAEGTQQASASFSFSDTETPLFTLSDESDVSVSAFTVGESSSFSLSASEPASPAATPAVTTPPSAAAAVPAVAPTGSSGHFDLSWSDQRVKLGDSLYELRAHHVFSLAYVNVMKLGASHEMGLRSFVEKKWHSTSTTAKVTRGFGIAVGIGTGIAAIVTVVPLVATVAVAAGSFAVKRGLRSRKRKQALGSVRKWEREVMHAKTNTAAKQADIKKQLRTAILSVGTVGEVVRHLAEESNGLIRLADIYLQRKPSSRPKVLNLNPEVADKRRWADADLAIQRLGASRKRGFWRDFQYTNGYLDSTVDSKKKERTKAKKTAGQQSSAVVKAPDDCDALRLRVKRVTFYNSLLIEYCRHMKASQRQTLDMLNQCRVTLWEALLQQAHLSHGQHDACSADMPCQSDLETLAQDLALFMGTAPAAPVDMFSDDSTTPRPISEAEADALAAELAAEMDFGDPAELFSQRTQKEATSFGKKMAAMLHAKPKLEHTWKQGGKKAIKRGAKEIIQLAAAAKNMTQATAAAAQSGLTNGANLAFGELTDFAVGHWKKDVPAGLVKARLEAEFEAEKKDQNVLYQFANDLTEKHTADHGYYLAHLTRYFGDASADEQAGQAKAAIGKLKHYEKRFNRDYSKYTELQKRVTEAGGFASCDEARQLCEHFVAMFKTLRKEENCVNFIYALAHGYVEMLLDDNRKTAFWLPAKTATGLDNWFAFWRPPQA